MTGAKKKNDSSEAYLYIYRAKYRAVVRSEKGLKVGR